SGFQARAARGRASHARRVAAYLGAKARRVTHENGALNYFNYFTEIEEHFQRARGTSLFLLSPLDWALVESWKNSGVPLEAVLRGIDAAFEKMARPQGKNPEGQFAGVLRPVGAHRSATDGWRC